MTGLHRLRSMDGLRRARSASGFRRARSASGFRLLPHTADVQLLAWGPSREACLGQAVRALAATFMSPGPGAERSRTTVAVPAGPDAEQLLAVLDEALYCVDVHGRVPVAAIARRLPDGGLSITFDTVPAARVVQTGSVPKAATRHALAFAGRGSRWRALVTIDV